MIPKWFNILWNIILLGLAVLNGFAIVHKQWIIVFIGLFLVVALIFLKSIAFALLKEAERISSEHEALKERVAQLEESQDWSLPSVSRETTKLR